MQSCSFAVFNELNTEDKFDCDFEQDISEDEILAVLSRLRRILNWDLDDNDNIYDKQRGHQIVRQGLNEYIRWKALINVAESPRLQHLVIYSLAKLCFYYWIKESDLVADILREVYWCDGHFTSMFTHVVNRHDRHSLWRQISKKREEPATVYFIHHAYKAKLHFLGLRFVDIPLHHPLSVPPTYLAAIYNRPHLLMHLVRYGANVDILPFGPTADSWSLPMLLRHLVRILWNSLGEDLQQVESESALVTVINSTMNDVRECLRILLRVIPQIPMNELNFLLMKFSSGGILSGAFCSHEFIRMLSQSGLIPKFANRYLVPSDLRHLSRCVIRNCLNKSWNLPYGVNLLPVPTFSKRYLSLMDD